MSLGWLNLSEENWNKRDHEKIKDVGHEAHGDDTTLECFKHILPANGQADWLAKLVEASEPVKEAMPGFVLFVLNLGRSDPFNIFKSRLHKVSSEKIKL